MLKGIQWTKEVRERKKSVSDITSNINCDSVEQKEKKGQNTKEERIVQKEKKEQEGSCDDASDVDGKTEKERVNIKHADEKYAPSTKEVCDNIENEDIDGIEDLFQIEIVEGEELYACNVCNEGFEKNEEIKKPKEKYHYQVVLQIRKEMYEDKEDGSDGIIKDNEKISMMIV